MSVKVNIIHGIYALTKYIEAYDEVGWQMSISYDKLVKYNIGHVIAEWKLLSCPLP